MAGAIKPTSVEGYLIRLYDTCEHLNSKMTQIETKMDNMVSEDRIAHGTLDTRLSMLESRITRAESQNIGAKDVKSSITPYAIALLSAILAMVGYVILHSVGIK